MIHSANAVSRHVRLPPQQRQKGASCSFAPLPLPVLHPKTCPSALALPHQNQNDSLSAPLTLLKIIMAHYFHTHVCPTTPQRYSPNPLHPDHPINFHDFNHQSSPRALTINSTRSHFPARHRRVYPTSTPWRPLPRTRDRKKTNTFHYLVGVLTQRQGRLTSRPSIRKVIFFPLIFTVILFLG